MTIFALTSYSAAHAENTIPPVGITQNHEKTINPSGKILLALNDNMDDLEITMELMDESSESSAAIVNRIQLPAPLQKRERNREQKTDREGIEEVREQVKEQQADMINEIHEQAQEIRENNEMIEDVREQVKEQQADAVGDIHEQAREIREENKESAKKGR